MFCLEHFYTVLNQTAALIENKTLPAIGFVDTIPSYWWSFSPQNWSSYGADVSFFPNDSEWNIDVLSIILNHLKFICPAPSPNYFVKIYLCPRSALPKWTQIKISIRMKKNDGF